jgi:hypothetical protein
MSFYANRSKNIVSCPRFLSFSESIIAKKKHVVYSLFKVNIFLSFFNKIWHVSRFHEFWTLEDFWTQTSIKS